MSYIVDTDWVIDYLRGQTQAIQLLDELSPQGLAISIITFIEVYEGIYRGRERQRTERIFRSFLRVVKVLEVTRTVARRTAHIRGYLRQQKLPTDNRAFDLVIAGTALSYDLTLVTRNLRHYNDIPELKLYPLS